MTEQQQNIAIAMHDGYHWYRSGTNKVLLLHEKPANPVFEGPLEFVPAFIQQAVPVTYPRYTHDRNSIIPVIAKLSDEQKHKFAGLVEDATGFEAVVDNPDHENVVALTDLICTDPAILAECLLKTCDKWTL